MRAVIYAFRSPGSGAVYVGKHECDPTGWPLRGTGPLPDGYRGSGVVVGHFHRRHGAAVQWRILAVVGGDRDAVNAAERRAIRLARLILGRRCVNVLEGGDGLTSAEASRRWADPEYHARHTASLKQMAQGDHWRASNAAQRAALLNDPDIQARKVAALQTAAADPEWRARIADVQRTLAQSPERREQLRMIAIAANSDPAERARKSARGKALTATPEGRAKLDSFFVASRSQETQERRKEAARSPDAIAKRKATKLRNFIRAANARNKARREAAMEEQQ